MPREMHAIWWDDHLGPMVGRSCPEGASLSTEEALRIFMGHGINQEAKIGYTNLGRGLVVSILIPPNCIAILLNENEDPQVVERNLLRLVEEMNLNSSEWESELSRAFDRLNALLRESSKDEILARDDVRRLVNDMMDGRIESIEPVHVLRQTDRYPVAAQYLSGDDEEVARTLRDLESTGILVAKSHGRKLTCTRCSSTEVVVGLACPNCNSTDLYKIYRLHCPNCGQVTQSVIVDNMEEISCQHCKAAIPVQDLRVLGIEMLCNSCSTATPDPLITLTCASCGKCFSSLDILSGTGLAFELSPAGKKERAEKA
ncbi:MAG: hypothetical protein ACTSPX_01395 [Candidatus Thorarchaeota archaeon]